tara:strand:+ start:788 stop:1027 length:240 start_codon:yes stop_codon:yes gene_type:complete
MNSYKFDWKNTLTGTIELEAENGTLAEEKLMNMTLKELLEQSKYVSDDKGRSIRFVDLDGNNFSDSLDEQDWHEHKSIL